VLRKAQKIFRLQTTGIQDYDLFQVQFVHDLRRRTQARHSSIAYLISYRICDI
jgi:hypothetical protein